MSIPEHMSTSADMLELRLKNEGTPSEQLEKYIAQIERTHGELNAVVQRNFDAARARAEEQTAHLQKNGTDGLSPLYGMPCTIKDNYKVKGFPFTAGLASRADEIADSHAVLVQRMLDAGMNVMGLTNVPEALLWYDTDNKLYGRTYNPWDLERSPGGSSGGESAIIAAGGSPIGMGGDIGGSIRNPANFCGIVGHKPSPGILPESGTWGSKPGYTIVKQYKVPGPLGRSVAEVEELLKLSSGPDGYDENCTSVYVGNKEPIDWSEITVYWYETNGIIDPDGEVCQAIFDAIDIFKGLGCRIERWQPMDIDRSFELYVAALKEAGNFSYAQRLGDGKAVSLLETWKQMLLRQSPHIFAGVALATYEAILDHFPKDRSDDVQKLAGLKYIFERKMGMNSIILSPSWPHVAPRIGMDIYKQFFGFTYCALYNILEMPATVVPVRIGESNMPVGVHIAGLCGNDALTLAAAKEVEAHVGHFASPMMRRSAE